MDRVTQALKTLNYSEIARKAGTTPGFVSMLFNGHRRAKVGTLREIAKALGVTLDDLDRHLVKIPAPENKYPDWTSRKKGKSTPVASAA